MRVACIIQARMGSKRLPGKVKMDIGGRPMIWHVEERAKASGLETKVAWPSHYENENDVLGRYARIATEMGLDAVCRITGDCPLMAPEAIQRVLLSFQTYYMAHPYVANDILPSYPNGIGVEMFTIGALLRADDAAITAADREHVSLYMKRDKLNNPLNIPCPINGITLPDLKLSVDTQKDLDFVRAIDAAGPRDFSLVATLEAIQRVKDQNHA